MEFIPLKSGNPWGMQLDGRCGNMGVAYDKYKFVGNERDVETNYDYLGDRYYDSRIGRELSVDPFADDAPAVSPYSYASNNPIAYYDDNGDSTQLVNDQYVTDPVYSIPKDNKILSIAKRTSPKGIDFIERHERFEPLIYPDATGHPTIGYGHKLSKIEISSFNGGITLVQAKVLLSKDLIGFEYYVNHYVKVPITQEQFDALVDFTFNEGPKQLANSTLLRHINSLNFKNISHWFEVYNKGRVNGVWRVIPGLVPRREDETNLFINGEY